MVKLMKLNGTESFISSMLSRMIKHPRCPFFISQEQHRGSENAPSPKCIFKGGHYFQGVKEKIKIALFYGFTLTSVPF